MVNEAIPTRDHDRIFESISKPYYTSSNNTINKQGGGISWPSISLPVDPSLARSSAALALRKI